MSAPPMISYTGGRSTAALGSYVLRKEKIMKLLFSALMILLVVSVSTKAQGADVSGARPFHISSLNTAFAMQGDFKGEYRIYHDRIEVKVTKANIRIRHHCPYKGRRLLSAIKVGLATNTDGKG